MLKDYYAILGVPADVDLPGIKTAYRSLSMRFHPDRGGSHEKMLEINEAYEILSSPSSRAEYDRQRLRLSQQSEDLTEAIRRAKANAPNYARSWSEFDAFLKNLSNDFASASYGTWRSGVGPMPTAGPSLTGWLFIIAGGTLGAWLAISLFELHRPLPAFMSAVGAWCGKFVHSTIRGVLQTPNIETFVRCVACAQALRVRSRLPATVRCLACGAVFRADSQADAARGTPTHSIYPERTHTRT